MPEEGDVDKKIWPVKKTGGKEDIYEGIESHFESIHGEDRKGGPMAPMEDLRGPIVLSPSTYVEEDSTLEEEKRRPAKGQKKKRRPRNAPEDKYAAPR